MVQWVENLAKHGYRLVTKPQYRTRPTPDPQYPGYTDVIVTARWQHDGIVTLIPGDVIESQRQERERIGASDRVTDGGVEKYLRENPGTEVLSA